MFIEDQPVSQFFCLFFKSECIAEAMFIEDQGPSAQSRRKRKLGVFESVCTTEACGKLSRKIASKLTSARH